MFRPRIIPILLLRGKGLVKSKKFKDYRYIGDPINAVKLFNDLKADELVFLDILATDENRSISLDFVKKVGDEANMPFSVGGGISTISQIKKIINAGAEKVIINSKAAESIDFIKKASQYFGSSTIVVSIDVRKKLFGGYKVYFRSGSKSLSMNVVDYAKLVSQNGAGEIIINSIDKDGTMTGYDLALVESVSKAVPIPVVAAGGASSFEDFRLARNSYASAVAAGAMFVYQGPRNAVLINYPDENEIKNIFL